MPRRVMVIAAVGIVLLGASKHLWAGSKIQSFGPRAVTIGGAVETNVNGNRDPWVAQLGAEGNGQCLTISVIQQGADLEATLVSPSGQIWQDDNSNGQGRPRINAETDVRGWYVLTVSEAAGAEVNADFILRIQRLRSCEPVTTALREEDAAGFRSDARALEGPRGPRGGAN